MFESTTMNEKFIAIQGRPNSLDFIPKKLSKSYFVIRCRYCSVEEPQSQLLHLFQNRKRPNANSYYLPCWNYVEKGPSTCEKNFFVTEKNLKTVIVLIAITGIIVYFIVGVY